MATLHKDLRIKSAERYVLHLTLDELEVLHDICLLVSGGQETRKRIVNQIRYCIFDRRWEFGELRLGDTRDITEDSKIQFLWDGLHGRH